MLSALSHFPHKNWAHTQLDECDWSLLQSQTALQQEEEDIAK